METYETNFGVKAKAKDSNQGQWLTPIGGNSEVSWCPDIPRFDQRVVVMVGRPKI